MKLNDHIDMKGRLRIRMQNRMGETVLDFKADNDIVLTGRDLVARLFINEAIDPISHLAVGTGGTEVNPEEDNTLENELFRKAIMPIDPTEHLTDTEDGKKKVFISAELDFTEGNGALTEAGLFNSDASGVMYNRVVFAPVNKTEDFKLVLVWEIVF